MDGSPPLYYFRQGGPQSKDKWVIHQQGGAWCTSLDDCYNRSLSRLGSSQPKYGWQAIMDFATVPGCQNARWCGGLFLNDPGKNHLTYDWNAVFIVYCDGGSQIGNNQSVTMYQNHRLYFDGHRILQAIIENLVLTQELDEATDIIVGGDSAGGLSTFLHLDEWARRFPSARVTGVPDSGFFMDLNSSPTPFSQDMQWMYTQMNGSAALRPGCLSKFPPSLAYRCLFPEHFASLINTPMFILQSQYDEYQIQSVLGSNKTSDVESLGGKIQAAVSSVVSGSKHHGGFLDSCYHHCGGWGMKQDMDYLIKISGDTAMTAFVKWYKGNGNKLWVQDQPYPCNTCCSQSP
uniref:Pectin acetylesterase n=1 Tax=Arcella intermedia TaxID=1963864 RepID=A0A6B2L8H8_9EUKA